MKRCTKCLRFLDRTAFRKDASAKDGLRYQCGDCLRAYRRMHYRANAETIRRKELERAPRYKERLKSYYERNRTRIIEQHKERLRDPRTRESYNQFFREYYQRPGPKLAHIMRVAIRNALRGKLKTGRMLELIGCDIQTLRIHLEAQFVEGMNWTNHGNNGWHVDHVIPCASFDLTDSEQQRRCFHYTNLQPLWAIDNIRKSNKL